MTEQQIQKKINDYLESLGAHVTKYNANGYGVLGHPDLFVSWANIKYRFPIAFFVEVKTEIGELSPTQKTKIERMRKDRNIVFVARSVDDLKKQMRENGL